MTIANDKNIPLVTVVIPTYNYGHFVEQAVESALSQRYPNIEVIVVDDGSQDDTKARLEKYRGRIQYIYQRNQGLSAARNTGILKARGEYIAFLDADDIWIPEKISEQIGMFKSVAQIGLVSCSIVNFLLGPGCYYE